MNLLSNILNLMPSVYQLLWDMLYFNITIYCQVISVDNTDVI